MCSSYWPGLCFERPLWWVIQSETFQSSTHWWFLEKPKAVTYSKCFRPSILLINIKVVIHGGHSFLPAKSYYTFIKCYKLQSPLRLSLDQSREDRTGVSNLWSTNGHLNVASDQAPRREITTGKSSVGVTVIIYYSYYSQYLISHLHHLHTVILSTP